MGAHISSFSLDVPVCLFYSKYKELLLLRCFVGGVAMQRFAWTVVLHQEVKKRTISTTAWLYD